MKKRVLEFINKILIGMSISIVVALVPQAFLGELAKLLKLDIIVDITTFATSLLPAVMGLCIAKQFKLPPIHSATLAITTMIGAGSLSLDNGVVVMSGFGDVINAGLTASLATILLLYFNDKLKAYTMLILPTIIIIGVGSLGLLILPAVEQITQAIGNLVEVFTTFTPIVSTALISATFAFLIISPVSSVGVAVAISLTGVTSAAANLGACTAGFALAIFSYRQSGFSASILQVLGSPKVQMANLIKKPKIVIPVIFSALIVGTFASIFNLYGTNISAGFGMCGMVGPIANLSYNGYTLTNIITTIVAYVLIPILTSFIAYFIFIKKLKFVSESDYKIEFK